MTTSDLLFDENLNIYLQNLLGSLVNFFAIVSFMGDEIFFIVLFMIIYWAFNKKMALKIFSVLLLSTIINYTAKYYIWSPRPSETIWKVPEQQPGLPSGHAQASTVFWGILTIEVKNGLIKRLLFIFVPIWIFLISLSRLVLGVHFLGDVIVGFLIGLMIVIFYWRFCPRIEEKIRNLSFEKSILFVTLFTILITGVLVTLIFFRYFYTEPVRFYSYTIGFSKLISIFIGVNLGYLLEEKYVKLKNVTESTARLKRVLFGSLVTVPILIPTKLIEKLSDVYYYIFLVITFHFLVGVFSTFFAPYIINWLESRAS